MGHLLCFPDDALVLAAASPSLAVLGLAFACSLVDVATATKRRGESQRGIATTFGYPVFGSGSSINRDFKEQITQFDIL